MRLIHRRALIVVVAVALGSSMTVLPSVASAAKKKTTPIQALSKRVTTLSKKLNTVTNNLKNVTSTVNGGIPIITQLVSGVTQLKDGLTALQGGLKQLSDAVTNTTTGLPGLNAARSLIGAVVGGTAQTGSEFSVVAHAIAPGGLTGTGGYLLSFVNGQGTATDVSKRVFAVTSANPAQLAASAPVYSAVDCAANAGATGLCTAINGGTADSKNTDVAVITRPDAMDFQIAAISG